MHSKCPPLKLDEKPVFAMKKTYRTQCLLMFLCGVGLHVDFFFFGRLTAADVLVLTLLPLTAINALTLKQNVLLSPFAFLTAYFTSSLFSSLANTIPLTDLMKGLAKPTLMLAAFLFFVWAIRTHPRSLLYFALGGTAGSLLLFFAPGLWTREMAEKSQYGNTVARVVPLLAALTTPVFYLVYKRSQVSGGAFMGGIGLARAAIGASRGQIVTTLLSSLMLIASSRRSSTRSRVTRTKPTTFAAAIGLAVAGFSVLTIAYPYAAKQGLLGTAGRVKYLRQSKGGELSPFQTLMASRSEVYAAFLGVCEHPFIGVGSWNREATGKYLIESSDRLDLGRTQAQVNALVKEGKGAGHSIFLQEWLEQGIGAALFWIFAAFVIGKGMAYNLRNASLATAFYVPSAITFYLSLVASPLDHITRITTPLLLCLGILQQPSNVFSEYLRLSFDFTPPWREILSSKDARFMMQRREALMPANVPQMFPCKRPYPIHANAIHST